MSKILSTFPAIDTSVDRLKITKTGKYRPGHGSRNAHPLGFSAVWARSFIPAINTIGSTGSPAPTVAAPHLGAWMAKVLGPKNEIVPPFINIGQRLGRGRRN